MHIHYAEDGKTVIMTDPGTQPAPAGGGPRDSFGRPLAGPHAGEFPPGQGPDAPASRFARIAAAIKKVPRDQADAWTTTGKPKVEAVEQVLGEQISRDERDAVWGYLTVKAAETTTDKPAAAGKKR